MDCIVFMGYLILGCVSPLFAGSTYTYEWLVVGVVDGGKLMALSLLLLLLLQGDRSMCSST